MNSGLYDYTVEMEQAEFCKDNPEMVCEKCGEMYPFIVGDTGFIEREEGVCSCGERYCDSYGEVFVADGEAEAMAGLLIQLKHREIKTIAAIVKEAEELNSIRKQIAELE